MEMKRLFCQQFCRLFFVSLASIVWGFLPGQDARAQGCVASRESVCVIGSHTSNLASGGISTGESWLSPKRWQLSADYRYYHSHRHFVGTSEQVQRAERRTEVNNIAHILNVAATYDISSRFNFTVSAPLYFFKRYNQSTPDQVTHANGIGDITLVGRGWLFNNPSESRQNIAVGFGAKLPSGRSNVVDTVNTANGPVTRIVDQSIQPGDGGYGMIADFQAYKGIKQFTLYASGSYLANPQNTNGVRTGRSRPSEAIMSIADQYAYRAGAVFTLPKLNSLVGSLGIRGEGVPSKDLFGKSEGFRRPGYILSVDPGLIYTRGKDRWSFNIPVPFVRARTRSFSDLLVNGHGDAAFADYTILLGYSRRF
jgi:hypothetical protein